jgi:uracil-DNA glycosylase family 4
MTGPGESALGAGRHALAQHLKFFGELAIEGVSRDPGWRARASRCPEGASAEGSGPPEGDFKIAEPAEPVADLDAASALLALRDYVGPDCTRCKLGTLGRRQVVFGVGNPQAELMFVGEAPGADEDARGEPFVGRAGQLLTKIIEAIGLTRAEVYIANVIKCRPPNNRAPEPDEVVTCEPFLARQIEVIRPRIIVALGTHATHALLKTDAPISRLRGRVHDFRGGIKLVPTFHPAFLLRSPERKRDVWEDMKKVRALLDEPRA